MKRKEQSTSISSSPTIRRFSIPKNSKFSLYGHFKFSFQITESEFKKVREGNSSVHPAEIIVCHNLPIKNTHTYFIANTHKSFHCDVSLGIIHLKHDCMLKVEECVGENEWNIQLVNGEHLQRRDTKQQDTIQKQLHISRMAAVSKDHIVKISTDLRDKLSASSRLLIVGDIMCHKTLYTRFCANEMIKRHGRVFILQTNPENGNFNAPGVLTLVQMNDCLFDALYLPNRTSGEDVGYSFGVERRFDVCYGHDSAEEDVEHYLDCVQQLMNTLETWQKEYPTIPAIMDTTPFSDSVLHDIVSELPQLFQPTDTLVCHNSETKKEWFVKSLEEHCSSCRVHDIQHGEEQKEIVLHNKNMARHQRAALLSFYFGCSGSVTLTRLPRYKCHWSLFGISMHGPFQNKSVQEWRSVMHVLNGALVALFSSSDEAVCNRLSAETAQSFSATESAKPLFVLGRNPSQERFQTLALIAHVDMASRCFHIVTPKDISLEILKAVNLIQFCSIRIPDALLPNDQTHLRSNPHRVNGEKLFGKAIFNSYREDDQLYRGSG